MESSSSSKQSQGQGQGPRTFRRGETIFKAGDPITQIYIVQSGLAVVTLTRGGKPLEVAQVGVGQLLGEEALWGRKKWSVSAVANNDVRMLPVDVAQAFTMMSSGAPLIKIFLKGLIEKQRYWWTTLLDIRGESDPTPCPPSRVTQLFAVIHQAATYTGTKKNGALVIVWPTFKKYCQRTFLESPVRLEQAVNILVRLGVAKLEMIPCETDPEAPDELGFVHFTDIDRVRDFYKFFRQLTFAKNNGTMPATSEFNIAVLREIDEWNKKGKVELPKVEDSEQEAA